MSVWRLSEHLNFKYSFKNQEAKWMRVKISKTHSKARALRAAASHGGPPGVERGGDDLQQGHHRPHRHQTLWTLQQCRHPRVLKKKKFSRNKDTYLYSFHGCFRAWVCCYVDYCISLLVPDSSSCYRGGAWMWYCESWSIDLCVCYLSLGLLLHLLQRLQVLLHPCLLLCGQMCVLVIWGW